MGLLKEATLYVLTRKDGLFFTGVDFSKDLQDALYFNSEQGANSVSRMWEGEDLYIESMRIFHQSHITEERDLRPHGAPTLKVV